MQQMRMWQTSEVILSVVPVIEENSPEGDYSEYLPVLRFWKFWSFVLKVLLCVICGAQGKTRYSYGTLWI